MSDSRPRLVRVEFIREGVHMVEHYLCPEPADLVAFFEWTDETPMPRFGGQATMTIHYIQTFAAPAQPAAEVKTKRTPTKRAAKKQPARKRA